MVVEELFATLGLKLDAGSWLKGDKAIGGVKTALGTLTAGIGLASIAHMVIGVAELGGELSDTSQSAGVAVESLQELRYAASLAGVGAGELSGALRLYSRGLQEATAKGEGPLVDAFKKLKISMKDIKGETIEQNLEVIAEAFKKLPDGPEKTAVAMKVFGRSGASMIPFLNEGQEGIKKLRNEAHDLGIVMSEETVASMDQFGDDMDRTKAALQGVKIQVVSALLPALQGMIDRLLGWIKANRELIGQGLHVVIEVAKVAFEGLAFAIDSAVAIIKWFQEGSDLAKAVLMGIAYVILSAVVPALLAMAAGWVAALAPVLLTIAAVAAISLALFDLYKSITTGKGFFADAWRFIKSKANDFWEWLKDLPGRVVDVFKSIGRGIIDTMGEAFDYLVRRAKEVADEIWTEIKDIPVIGRIAQGVEAVTDAVGITGTAQSLADSDAKGGSSSSTVNAPNITSTVNVTAAPGMSEAQLAQQIDEKQKASLRQAYDSVSGGRR